MSSKANNEYLSYICPWFDRIVSLGRRRHCYRSSHIQLSYLLGSLQDKFLLRRRHHSIHRSKTMGISCLCIHPNASSVDGFYGWHNANNSHRAIRMAFFIKAGNELSRRNTNKQDERILAALRRNGIDANAGNANLISRNILPNQPYPLAYYMQQLPPRELLGDTGTSRESPNLPAYTP